MAEEATTQTAPAAQPQTAPETAPNPMEKVYSDFKIEDTAASFQPQPQTPAPTQPTQPAFKAPDPFDPNFGNWQQGVQGTVSQINQAVTQTANELAQMRQAMQSEKVEAAIKQAAGAIAESAGIKPKLAQALMEVEARDDARFRSIWQNREKNPAAWAAAQKALASKLREEYSVRQDPQLAENQRAMKVSQQQMATTTKTSEQDDWASMSPGDRQAKVRTMMKLGGRSG